MTTNKNTKITKLPDSIVEIESNIPSDDFLSYEDKAFARIKEHVESDGLRKGTAPKNLVIAKIGDISLLEEMAEMAIGNAYIQIIKDNNIDAIGRPEITITKIARGNDLEFKIKTAVVPEIKLPDYNKIAKKIEKENIKEVTDEDVAKTILEIQRMRAHEDAHIALSPEDQAAHKHPEIKDEDLPVVDDAFVKTLGAFENVEDFKTKMKENMIMEGERLAKEKRRIAIIEKLIEETEVDVPRMLVDIELDRMFARLRGDIEQSGLKMEDYLSHLKKDENAIRSEWENDAKKRAKSELIIDAISKKENIVPDPEKVEKEAEMLKQMYKDVDPIRARDYVTHFMMNQQVIEFLENLS